MTLEPSFQSLPNMQNTSDHMIVDPNNNIDTNNNNTNNDNTDNDNSEKIQNPMTEENNTMVVDSSKNIVQDVVMQESDVSVVDNDQQNNANLTKEQKENTETSITNVGNEETEEENDQVEISKLEDADLLSSRPKRRSTKEVNYKEKLETDIPSAKIEKETKRPYKIRRTKTNSDSTSPPPLPSAYNNNKSGNYYDVEDVVPINYQPPISPDSDFNDLIDIKSSKIDAAEVTLTLKNGVTIKKGDCIYMICEPPSEPFYIAQVLGFTKKDKTSNNKKASNYMFSVCWFYRPRDLNRRLTDTRLVYASLHRDNCPITSFRGFATVKHKFAIDDLESYRQEPDCFYFDKLYDRYMIKMYDMIPTIKLIHLPPNYYKALHKRFEYIFVEVGKADELLSSPKNCEKCLQWCSNKDSILCSGCQKSYHLLCLDPPILTKPKRGFAWYCASCNKSLEEKLAKNRGKMLESSQPSQIMKAEKRALLESADASENSLALQDNNYDNQEEADSSSLRYEQLAKKFLDDDKNLTLKKRREVEEWPYRYLGVHAKFEDALDIQDRPYARAASRLGSKYQCTSLTEWHDHVVQYYDADDLSATGGLLGPNNKRLKKYYNRSKKSSTPIQPEEDEFENKKFPIPEGFEGVKPRDFPGWLQPKPKGYIERGDDETSTLLWEMPPATNELNETELGDMVEKYIKDCSSVAKRLKLTTVTTPNFIDAILLILMRHNYKPDECMDDVNKLTRESLKEPTFTNEEVKRFEDSVRLHGSELYPVFKDVGTQTSAMVVRFYYLWKKTKNGHEIWDNFPGRAKNRLMNATKNVSVDLDNPEDDGAFFSSKINKFHIKFKCMYCETNHSPEWFRSPGAVQDEKNHLCEGLCYRCAKLWRKYATKWENPVELIKNQEKKSAYAVKRKTEFALIQEAELVVNARESYKQNPRLISDGLKDFKTIDTDYNYNGSIVVVKPKKKTPRSYIKNASSASSTTSLPTITNVPSTAPSDSKTKVKKEKKDSTTSSGPGRKPKRAIKEVNDAVNEELKNEDDKPKKRKYKKRQSNEKSLKFVYGKVIDDNSSGKKKLTTKRKECDQSNIEPTQLSEKMISLKEELNSAKIQLEENSKGGLFNAFLDMKLRERIESLEKEVEIVAAEDKKHAEIDMTNLLSSITTAPSSSRPSTKDSDVLTSNRKYVRRRLYLSKTSVPGSGVFETPPIQLPTASSMLTASPTTQYITEQISSNPNNFRNKFVFQMYDQHGTDPDYSITGSEFQSQPNMLPQNALTSSDFSESQNGLPQLLPPSSAASNLSTSSINTSDVLPSSSSRPNSSRDLVPSSRGKHAPASQGFYNISFKGKEFLNLTPSFKVKMLTPLIDYNDSITKDMISRYTSKFDVFNPLLSDDYYVSPIYQMRSSSKELHSLWKAYQTSRKSKGRVSKSFQPLFNVEKRPCCVCRTYDDPKTVLICSNCGLNVHASCYGVQLDPKMKKAAGEYNWHCDPCSNDLHPLVSTQYVCLLCNSRESNMDQAIKGDPVSIPDALKRTVEGRWCHITCSLLSEDIKYGSKTLQPVYGANIAGVTNIFQTCEICMSNGGAIVGCDLCSRKAHVTCGLDFSWKIGFKVVQLFDIDDGDVIEIKDENIIGKLQPVIYCDEHESDNLPKLYPLTHLGKKLNSTNNEYKPIFELFCSDNRKMLPDLPNGVIRRRAYDEMSNAFDALAIKTSQHNELLLENSQLEKSHLCTKCHSTSSLSWRSNVEGIEGEICNLCFTDINNHGSDEYKIPDLDAINVQKFDYSVYGC